ncbi:5-(carboxyamino)imidazole ribonucleotide synthase [Nitratireductor thuwali]|uniref:N5-carboxyaminoimidazole ribonucleotide synthase n=1 Tax=Nitratireductor thuwali TaxID=2267699 RepID=A0ABY5MHH9_9HYPH|nr:N5-carboxyaminoimidazole ribonucleotide synthase [Nitratireductor thuwali]
MKRPLSPGKTVGIIGGGQLGRMLAMAAARLGFRTIVLEPDAECPAAQVTNSQIVAPYNDAEALEQLTAASDVVTYEFENIPIQAARAVAGRVALFPPTEALEAAQDRLTEKIFLNSTGISTARFVSVDSDEALALALKDFGSSGVLKTRRMGYDGKGQRVFRNATSRETAGAHAELGGVPLLLESLMPFEREISVIAARGADGSMVAYDPAENEHRGGILRRTLVPARISARTARDAQDAAFQILRTLDYVGVIGVEFFVLEDGAIVANELAPRVHNSGHWTEAACACSQFEQHIRAIAGLPLGDTTRLADCEMHNLLGDEQDKAAQLLAEKDVVVHLYGKAESRPDRKMGHFTRLIRG